MRRSSKRGRRLWRCRTWRRRSPERLRAASSSSPTASSMWWSDRAPDEHELWRLPAAGGNKSFAPAVAALALVLSACGFQPMYGQRAPEATEVFSDLAAVEVGVIPDRSGQLLRNELVRLLNPAADSRPARYTLAVVLKEAVDTFAVESRGRRHL